jgi:hypothetical protein
VKPGIKIGKRSAALTPSASDQSGTYRNMGSRTGWPEYLPLASFCRTKVVSLLEDFVMHVQGSCGVVQGWGPAAEILTTHDPKFTIACSVNVWKQNREPKQPARLTFLVRRLSARFMVA